MHRVPDPGLIVGANPVGKRRKAIPQVRPEGLPATHRHRQRDRPEAGDVLAGDLPSLAAGFDNAGLKTARRPAEADKHAVTCSRRGRAESMPLHGWWLSPSGLESASPLLLRERRIVARLGKSRQSTSAPHHGGTRLVEAPVSDPTRRHAIRRSRWPLSVLGAAAEWHFAVWLGCDGTAVPSRWMLAVGFRISEIKIKILLSNASEFSHGSGSSVIYFTPTEISQIDFLY